MQIRGREFHEWVIILLNIHHSLRHIYICINKMLMKSKRISSMVSASVWSRAHTTQIRTGHWILKIGTIQLSSNQKNKTIVEGRHASLWKLLFLLYSWRQAVFAPFLDISFFFLPHYLKEYLELSMCFVNLCIFVFRLIFFPFFFYTMMSSFELFLQPRKEREREKVLTKNTNLFAIKKTSN